MLKACALVLCFILYFVNSSAPRFYSNRADFWRPEKLRRALIRSNERTHLIAQRDENEKIRIGDKYPVIREMIRYRPFATLKSRRIGVFPKEGLR